MILRVNYSLNIISCKEEIRMREFFKWEIGNWYIMGWIVPLHASSIYKVKYQPKSIYERRDRFTKAY